MCVRYRESECMYEELFCVWCEQTLICESASSQLVLYGQFLGQSILMVCPEIEITDKCFLIHKD